MRRAQEVAIYHRELVAIEGGKFVTRTKPETVRVMARADGYAMVRHIGAVPFVVSEKSLTPWKAREAS